MIERVITHNVSEWEKKRRKRHPKTKTKTREGNNNDNNREALSVWLNHNISKGALWYKVWKKRMYYRKVYVTEKIRMKMN